MGAPRDSFEPQRSVFRPSLVFLALALFALGIMGASVFLALHQNHVPVPIRASGEHVEVVLPEGVAKLRGLSASPDGPWFEPTPDDLVEDPDALPSYAATAAFVERQTALHRILSSDRVAMLVELGGDRRVASFDLRPRRLGDLPTTFFAVLFTAVVGFLLAGWVWALRQRQRSAIALVASGLGMLLTLVTINVVNTREVAIDGSLLAALGRVNHVGAALFGAAMIALFASYPTTLLSRRALVAAMIAASSWAILDFFRIPPNAILGCYLPIVLETAAIFGLIVTQGIRSWKLPRERAALGWMGLSMALGIGAYVLLEPLPLLLGFHSPVAQGYTSLVFLIVYAGIALGVLRYRLFDLGTWAFRGLFYMVGVLLLLVCDALLVFVLHLDHAPSLGLSLLLVGFVYLPLRSVLHARATGRRERVDPKLIEDALGVAFEPNEGARSTRWRELLAHRFDALEVLETPPDFDAPSIEEEGLELAVPALPSLGAVRVRYPRRGRGLFREDDRSLVTQLLVLLEKVQTGREAYDRGVTNERKRMAQDLHDDIGARLVSGLYVADDKTRPILQAALADIRFLVGGLAGERIPLTRLLAELRRECVDRCNVAHVELTWPLPGESDVEIDYEAVKALRSATREAFTNVFRHAQASRVVVDVTTDDDGVTIAIEDDGVGFATADDARPKSQHGAGLDGMRSRLERVRGTCQIESTTGHTRVELAIPLPR